MNTLPHLRGDGHAHMVDVGAKNITARSATATGFVRLNPDAVNALHNDKNPKGDALAVARVAGLQAAKKTPDLVPLAHPISVSGVEVSLDPDADGVAIVGTVRSADRTGVEMEALTVVMVTALAVIDMVKAVDRQATVTDVRVVAKSGGRSGDWAEPGFGPAEFDSGLSGRALVMTVSDRCAAGEAEDRSGPILVDRLQQCGLTVEHQVVADGEPVSAALGAALKSDYQLVVTTGGTGVSPRDKTPEMTRPFLTAELPGVAEALRRKGTDVGVRTAVMSRGLVGLADQTVVVNLPGSTGGCRDGLAVIVPLLGHLFDQAAGGDHS